MAGTPDTKPFSPFEWLLAGRYLRARRKEGFISVIAGFSFLGIMLGVATLIIVMAVMNGFRKDLFSKILGLNGHVIVYKIGEPFDGLCGSGGKASPRCRASRMRIPIVEGQVMVSSSAQALGALVRGIAEPDLEITEARRREHSRRNARWIRRVAVDRHRAAAGQHAVRERRRYVTLVSPRGASTPFGTAPRSSRYMIAASSSSACRNTTRRWSSCRCRRAQRYFNTGRRGGRPGGHRRQSRAGRSIRDAEMRAAGGPTINITDWRQRNETFFTVLEVERNVMFMILSLIVLVAALNIISGLMMLVKDKGRDIAILRTMGATKGVGHARVPDHRRLDRRGRDARRARARHRVLLEYRGDPPVPSPG